ncbi:UPF0179 family protein [Methanococcus voltae]|uniref:UPF0179 protein J3E07_000088 n=2 Tax=Methanococcus voltae TaxID=2188 RepID=A0A8J7RZI2_METVO|nr:UPF0179 family protein [Methanococcus voltae]MBP2172354.1 uncharacterized protein (UPF0179 family) [Methanococcus voltae]MBP2200690.1 uncharacterized protein (UPF0179 family) [Methanococcus voltae]MCS3921415.1 uncharacterized protein (UPF0179 family) [Methanococcus voltae PS]
MTKITLIGNKLAVKDNEFVYMGPVAECDECKFKKMCHGNLEKGVKYKITEIRATTHPCSIHSEGVKVVEVIPSELNINIESKKALEGLTISHKDVSCDNVLCENYLYCKPQIESGKYKILSVLNTKVKCPLGNSLKRVLIKPIKEE